MSYERMKKVPSYLKGLVETRARADAHAQRLTAVLEEVRAALAKAERDRDSCDNLIRAYSASLEPDSIEPVRAWRGKYGPRGAFIGAIRDFVKAAYPAEVTSAEVEWHLIIRFKLDFPTSTERKHWKKISVLNKLQNLVRDGELERLEDRDEIQGVTAGRWRWRPDVNGDVEASQELALSKLARAARALGVPVGDASDAPLEHPVASP